METSHRCESCKVDIHRASMQKHLRSEKLFRNEKQYEMFIREWLFKEKQTPIKKKKLYNPKTLK